MKVLVTGVNGQLGHDVMNELKKRGHEAVGVDVGEMLRNIKPEAVIHCAAYTAVDRAEEEEELCRKINAEGTENIARVCGELDCKFLYLSTDYIFTGTVNAHGSRRMRRRR